jgi:hypothetical protein
MQAGSFRIGSYKFQLVQYKAIGVFEVRFLKL